MNERQPLSEQQHDWLRGQVNSWRGRGILLEEQAGQILALYETGEERQERRRSWLLYTLSALAMVLFGAATLLLVGYNWAALPAWAKLLLIFGAIVSSYASGIYLRYWRGARMASEALLLLGCLFYGAGIWLVAQIFHMSAHYPDGVFWWALGVLPLAILVDSLVLHALLVALVATWCGMEMINFSGLGGLLFGWRWPIPNLCLPALLMAAPGLLMAYRSNSLWRVALYVPLIVWWAVLQPVAWRFSGNPVCFIGAVVALLLVVAESHARGSRLAIPYRAYGALLFGGTLVPLSYWRFNAWMRRYESPWAALAMTGTILVLAASIFALAEYLRYRYLEQGQVEAGRRIDEMRRRQWLPLSLTVLMAGLSLVSISRTGPTFVPAETALIPTLTANVAMVMLGLWLIFVGLREERGMPFAAGVLYFLFWIVIRYIDLFGKVGGMLGASLLFFICGCVLLGMVVFWRNRKRVQYATVA
jgi:uncharacterized membrane protein